MTPEELSAKLLDPTYTAPNIYLVIEYFQLYFRPLSATAKQRLAGMLSLLSPVLGELLRAMQGRAALDWGTLAQLITALVNFLGSKAIHDLLDAKRRQPEAELAGLSPAREADGTARSSIAPQDVQAQMEGANR
ncbi:MAG TPA: hypothetical protein VF914_05520 [Chloroflexia bacterium]|jgi:hypothetical protein